MSNAELLAQLATAQAAVERLDGLGAAVLRVTLGPVPVITIRPNHVCERLGAEIESIRGTADGGREQVHAAAFDGCLVQWSSRGRWPFGLPRDQRRRRLACAM